jgi:hypothetical protein
VLCKLIILIIAGGCHPERRKILPKWNTKNDLHIRITAVFSGSGWGKLSGQNSLDLTAFGGLLERCKSALFWKTERLLQAFYTGTEKKGFMELSGTVKYIKKENGARIEPIFPQV